MLFGVGLLVTGWLLILPGTRQRRMLTVLGGVLVTVAMFSIVQARY